jgi:TRAP-type C4-dicarboxylate transport system permease small subunit
MLRALVSPKERHLKWPALDWLEVALYIGCGICTIGFSLSVLFDVATRQLGHPWLWLQQVTTGFFAYGVFIGMALAARRNEHMYLSEFVTSLQSDIRRVLEVLSRIAVLIVAMFLVVFGFQNFAHDLGSFRMPSLIPLGYYTIIIPISGLFIGLFQIEQLANGLKNGFAGPGIDVPEASYE